ncbi:MAG: DUF4071 domain-containing protein [Burkholderiales bacterium]|nr:DUF4071 domain-containing protein [Burkholderiales bacterium]
MKPVCFMVMPFGIKDVTASNGQAPGKVDFNRLWEAALKPAIVALGYEPVRADQEAGALIIHEMLERLFFADLVMADMSIPNGNVYYEIGVRHAAKPNGCVLVSADWATPLFDVQQMRRIVYPLPQQTVSDEQAAAIADCIRAGVPGLSAGDSPMFQVLPGYPNPSQDRALTMRRELEEFAAFTEAIQAVSLVGDRAVARQQALEVAARYLEPAHKRASVAMAIVQLLRDQAGWDDTLAYLATLPQTVQDLPFMKEQKALAQSSSKAGDHDLAIAALESLIKSKGESSERLGLIGGRYKRKADAAKAAGDEAGHRRALRRSIEAYEKGMRLELGDFYCVSNLARLYRARGEANDTDRAQFAQRLTVAMADAAIQRGTSNEWTRPTLLGAAFDAGDLVAAREALARVEVEGPAQWKLATTLKDLERSLAQISDPERRADFQDVLDDLTALLPPAA